MPRQPQLPEECANCGRLAGHLIRDRCPTCYSYFLKRGIDRPPRLWAWKASVTVWEPAQAGDVCDCGEVAVERLIVPISEGGRGVLFLCEDCVTLEKRLSLSSSWAD